MQIVGAPAVGAAVPASATGASFVSAPACRSTRSNISLRAVAGIVALGQAPDLRLAGAAEVAAGRATLQGVPFCTLATRKATSPRICTWFGARCVRPCRRSPPNRLLPGAHAVECSPSWSTARPAWSTASVARLGALDLGVAAPDHLGRAGEKLRLRFRVDRGARHLTGPDQRRGIAPSGTPWSTCGACRRRWRGIIGAKRGLRRRTIGPAASGQRPIPRQPGQRVKWDELAALLGVLHQRSAVLPLPAVLCRRGGRRRRGGAGLPAAQASLGAAGGIGARGTSRSTW